MATEGANFGCFVLGLLDRRPMSGYDVKRLLERLKGLLGGSSFGKIYPTLHGLLKEGRVTMDVLTREDRPPKKVYTITQEGRRVLREWLEGPVPAHLSQRALMMRLVLARDAGSKWLIACVHQRRTQVVMHRDALKELKSQPEQADAGWQMALDYGLAVADAELGWLSRALDQALEEPLSEELVKTGRIADAG
jgi:DNA-binding PadR family transcriptional regulator